MIKVFGVSLTIFFLAIKVTFAGTISGVVTDKYTHETIIGATVRISGTTLGTITSSEGYFEINDLKDGSYNLEVRCVSYKTIISDTIIINSNDIFFVDFQMESDDKILEAVVITARINRENEITLMKERQNSSVAVESIGAKEMSVKGVSNAADGVKKISGITTAEAGQVIVRGLGDRYSITTLNGLPIASSNPDNKLIPLDLFQSSTIKNIVVKKVYEVSSFADYAGAHIDIETKENIGDDFFQISLNTGGHANSVFNTFYQSDKKYGLFVANNLSDDVKNMSSKKFSDLIKTNANVFGTSFNIRKRSVLLPDFGGSISFGHNYKLGADNILSVLAALSVGSSHETVQNIYKSTYSVQGVLLDEFTSDSYTSELDITSLVNINYSFNANSSVNYTFFYARNAIDNYKLREGFDGEGIQLIGSNSIMHVYHLNNHQIKGRYTLSDRWNLGWGASFGITGSDEPDRRQVMYRYSNGEIKLFTLNQQETMRYFGELNEYEAVGNVKTQFHSLDENIKVNFGATYKNKYRNYSSTRFYYKTAQIDPEINDFADIYNTDAYYNQYNISNGLITIAKDSQPRYTYYAGASIAAGFGEVQWNILSALSLNFGLRFEYSNQWVIYYNDASVEKESQLSSNDVFPALNIKYDIAKNSNIKLSGSKTVTRPGFIEMSPLLYKESYGTAEIRGNENLQNGYNYNFDLRYELFSDRKNNMLSAACYYKWLVTPIERVQEISGGSSINTFLNADNGVALGFELEGRIEVVKNLKLSANAAYIYTNVILPENGVYTDDNRYLQGASPYIANADVSYKAKINDNKNVIITIMYNLQGPRINTVGINGLSNVVQQAVNTLDFIGNIDLNEKWSVKCKVKNLLNTTLKYTQEVKSIGKTLVVERYKPGISINIGITCNI
jgi:hypothetical protein